MKILLNLFCLLLLMVNAVFAQRKYDVTFQFPPGVAVQKIDISYDDGRNRGEGVDSIRDTTHITGELFGRYANISVYAPDLQPADTTFWVSDKPAIITYRTGASPLMSNVETVEPAIKAAMEAYIQPEQDTFRRFIFSHPQGVQDGSPDDSTFKMLTRNMHRRILDFITLHPDRYYSRWIFRSWISNSSYLPTDTLLHFFNHTFPDSVQQSLEGRESMRTLLSRVNTKKGGVAPLFVTTDYQGNRFSLKELRGKYVLLHFWASWCVPCIQRLPELKAIQTRYPKAQLEILSFTLDSDYSKFTAAVDKYQITWPEIYRDRSLLTQYLIGAIPQYFLIDREGTVLYNGTDEKDPDLDKLKTLLEGKLGK